jgi:molybdenum cofactor guanylyltransferase
MIASENITGLILAGGAGRRVGGRDKGLILWKNRMLVAHVFDRLQPQVTQVLISCNRNFDQYAALPAATVADTRRDFQGPMAGLEAAIDRIDTDFLLLVPCDTPLLPADLGDRLLRPLDSSLNENVEISYAHDGERGQYLCAAIRCSCLPSLHQYLDDGNRSVRHWYQTRRSIAVDFADQAGCFRNYNYLD